MNSWPVNVVTPNPSPGGGGSNASGNSSNNNDTANKNNNYYEKLELSLKDKINNNIKNNGNIVNNLFTPTSVLINDKVKLDLKIRDIRIHRAGASVKQGERQGVNNNECYLIVNKQTDKIIYYIDVPWTLDQNQNASIKFVDGNLRVTDINNVFTQLDNDTDGVTGKIFNIYDMCGRLADPDGLKWHTGLLRNKQADLEGIIQFFADSAEFKNVFEDNNLNIDNSFARGDDPKETLMLNVEKPILETYYLGLSMNM